MDAKRTGRLAALVVVAAAMTGPAAAAEGGSAADRLGVRRGVCVVLGAGGDKQEPPAIHARPEGGRSSGPSYSSGPGADGLGLALELARRDGVLVYLQTATATEADAARRRAQEAGLYGTRLYVDHGGPAAIKLADELADGVVAQGPLAGEAVEREVLRVLHPGARAILGDRLLQKPGADPVGDWSHPYHGPDNNPFSTDRRIRGPFLTQFLTGPRMAPVPQLTVAAGGRVFKLCGHLGLRTPSHPWVNKLIAFNGSNGTVLWERAMKAGFMNQRQTIVATGASVYVGDDESCKVLNAATGAVTDEITCPPGTADGPVWKWMCLADGVIYALLGQAEEEAPEVRFQSDRGGWGWRETTPGFMRPDPEYPWTFGRTLVAIDAASKKLLWRRQETEAIDGRAVGVASGRVFYFRYGKFLACLDARTGRELWKRTPENAPDLFAAIGPYVPGANSGSVGGGGFPISPYLICSPEAVCLTGLPLKTLVVVSAEDGRLLYNRNYTGHLIINGNQVYAVAYGTVVNYGSWCLDLMTGKVLARFAGGLSCARPTGAPGGIFYRGYEGTVHYDPRDRHLQYLAPMRPSCTDGVTLANGHLYWWPWVCGCNFSLAGVVCLAPAGEFPFNREAVEADRLETGAGDPAQVAGLEESPDDWPGVRPESLTWTGRLSRLAPSQVRWDYDVAVPPEVVLTAPVAVGGLVFLGGSDGVIRCLDGATGALKWQAFTGGPVRIPPAIWQGRAFTGSGDGWIYAHEATTGRLLWRFRAAPAERRIMVHGSLASTWPVNSGVAVADGVAYAAAGMTCYDGTHVYALDAVTGRIKWQNNTSGHLNPDLRVGVSAQGMVLVHEGRLYLAGGNVVSPAVYDIADGRCLNTPPGAYQPGRRNSVARSGWALSVEEGQVKASGARFYTPGGPFFSPFSKTAVVGSCRDRQGQTVLVRRDGHVLCLTANQ